jgi:MFS family permease
MLHAAKTKPVCFLSNNKGGNAVMSEETLLGTTLKLRGRHILILSIGGAVWSIAAILGGGLLGFAGWPIVLAFIVIIGAILVVGAFYVRRAGQNLPETETRYQHMRRLYWTVFRFQYISIIIAVVLSFTSIQIFHLLLIIIALINGLHFIALGPILRWPGYAKGVLLCIIAVITLFLPVYVAVSGEHPFQLLLWWLVPGFGTTVIFWADAIPSLITITSQLRQIKAKPTQN